MAHLACIMHGKRVIVLPALVTAYDLLLSDESLTSTFHRSNGERCSATVGVKEVEPVLTIGGNRISPFDVRTSHAETIKMEARTQEYHRNRTAKNGNGRRRHRG